MYRIDVFKDPKRGFKQFIAHIIVPVLFGMTAACGSGTTASLQAWIDVPRDGANLVLNVPVSIQSHVYAREGVAEVLLRVNGEAYRSDPPAETGQKFTSASQEWIPTQGGTFLLEVIVHDRKGNGSAPAGVRVYVPLEAVPVEPTAPPVEDATVEVPTAEMPATLEPTLPPVLTFPPVVIEPTAIPPIQIELYAGSTALVSGECTTIQWIVQNATTVYLDGSPVAAADSRQVCPTGTTDYRVSADGPSGSDSKKITVTVIQPPPTVPPDSQGPAISGLSNSPDHITDMPQCGATTANISVVVFDPSGVSRVELHYRVVRGSSQGTWGMLNMSSAGGSNYVGSIGLAELQASLTAFGGGQVQYYIIAVDNRNNQGKSGTNSFEVGACVL
jgi:hypothetical protein